ncbi:unnamed protein product [Closterium sp. NIES-53]
MAPSSGGKRETDEGGSGRGAGGSGRGSGGGNLPPEAAEKQLQARWERIEEALGELPEDDEAEEKLMALKGQWFTDAFAFLSSRPPSAHLWCRHRTLTQPLLEPFYHYHSGPPDTRATLHVLWARMAGEMRACTRCVARYHAAKRVYEEEYVEEVVGPVLETLRRLDEERVAGELRALVGRAGGGTGGGVGAGFGGVFSGAGGVSSGVGSSGSGGQVLDAERDGPGVICLMFELLMYPRVLEDAEVFSLAGPVLVLVERHFDLSLTPGQRYPVFALAGPALVLMERHFDLSLTPGQSQAPRPLQLRKQTVRHVPCRCLSPLPTVNRTAADLRPIDPLLQQCMHALEYDLFDTGTPATGTGAGSGEGTGTGLGRAGAAGNATAPASAQGGAGVGGGREGGERPRVVHSKEDMWQGLLTM